MIQYFLAHYVAGHVEVVSGASGQSHPPEAALSCCGLEGTPMYVQKTGRDDIENTKGEFHGSVGRRLKDADRKKWSTCRAEK